MGDPHDWNSWDHYRTIHDRRLEDHPFVQDHDLEWEVVEDAGSAVLITLQGLIVCHKGVHVRVWKLLETRTVGQGVLQVRGCEYAYNAYFVNRFNILRYDNGHAEAPHEFHRHVFDLTTGEQLRCEILHRADFPVLTEVLTEVADIVGFDPYAA